MRAWSRRIFIVLGAVLIASLGAIAFDRISPWYVSLMRQYPLSIACLDPLVDGHIMGHPVASPPPHDDDPELADLRRLHSATVFMAGFQTNLPEPLFGEEENIRLGAEYLKGAVIEPGEVLSLDRCLGPRTKARGYIMGPMYSGNRIVPTVGGGICKIATTLFNAAVLANLEVVERHPHSMLVPYVPPGQDATISGGSKDLRLRNPLVSPIVIWAQSVHNTLYVTVYGPAIPPEVRWEHAVSERVPSPKYVVKNPELPAGAERTTIAGYDGMTVKSKIRIVFETGETIEKDLGQHVYRPLPTVIEVGL